MVCVVSGVDKWHCTVCTSVHLQNASYSTVLVAQLLCYSNFMQSCNTFLYEIGEIFERETCVRRVQ